MTVSDTPPPLTDEFLAEIRALSELAITQRDDENAPYLDTADSLVLDVPRLLAEVDRLRAENAALAAKLAAVEKVIEPSEWKPLSERHPEYFTPDTPEEAARKKGWKQGVDLLTQQLRAALGETGGTEDRPEHECQLDWFAEGDFCGGCDRDQAEAPGEQR